MSQPTTTRILSLNAISVTQGARTETVISGTSEVIARDSLTVKVRRRTFREENILDANGLREALSACFPSK